MLLVTVYMFIKILNSHIRSGCCLTKPLFDKRLIKLMKKFSGLIFGHEKSEN